MQYLKGFQTKQLPILERFALLISITVIWAYAHLLTASGAYKHRPEITQNNCRTDKAYLISSAPWLVTRSFLCLDYKYFHISYFHRRIYIISFYMSGTPITSELDMCMYRKKHMPMHANFKMWFKTIWYENKLFSRLKNLLILLIWLLWFWLLLQPVFDT